MGLCVLGVGLGPQIHPSRPPLPQTEPQTHFDGTASQGARCEGVGGTRAKRGSLFWGRSNERWGEAPYLWGPSLRPPPLPTRFLGRKTFFL